MTKIEIVNEAYSTPAWWWGWIAAGASWIAVLIVGAWLGLLIEVIN